MGRSGVVAAVDQFGFSDALGLAAGESGHPARPALDSSSLTCRCAPAGKGLPRFETGSARACRPLLGLNMAEMAPRHDRQADAPGDP